MEKIMGIITDKRALTDANAAPATATAFVKAKNENTNTNARNAPKNMVEKE